MKIRIKDVKIQAETYYLAAANSDVISDLARSHSFTLSVKTDSRDYINRMLFKDIY